MGRYIGGMMNATKILTREEIATVLGVTSSLAARSVNTWQNLIIFRLSCCCGLRVMEIVGLEIRDVQTAGGRPVVHIRKEITKGQVGKKRDRWIPLWWDAGTLEDLHAWREKRIGDGALPNDPYICGLDRDYVGQRLAISSVRRRWNTTITRALGEERRAQLSIHSGRHSFCSHALAGGRSLAEVRDAAGHADAKMTSEYLHAIDSGNVPDLFSR